MSEGYPSRPPSSSSRRSFPRAFGRTTVGRYMTPVAKANEYLKNIKLMQAAHMRENYADEWAKGIREIRRRFQVELGGMALEVPGEAAVAAAATMAAPPHGANRPGSEPDPDWNLMAFRGLMHNKALQVSAQYAERERARQEGRLLPSEDPEDSVELWIARFGVFRDVLEKLYGHPDYPDLIYSQDFWREWTPGKSHDVAPVEQRQQTSQPQHEERSNSRPPGEASGGATDTEGDPTDAAQREHLARLREEHLSQARLLARHAAPPATKVLTPLESFNRAGKITSAEKGDVELTDEEIEYRWARAKNIFFPEGEMIPEQGYSVTFLPADEHGNTLPEYEHQLDWMLGETDEVSWEGVAEKSRMVRERLMDADDSAAAEFAGTEHDASQA